MTAPADYPGSNHPGSGQGPEWGPSQGPPHLSPHPPAGSRPAAHRRRSPLATWLLGCGLMVIVTGFLAVAGVVGWLFYVGMSGPETFVVHEREIKPAHRQAINGLRLLEDGESIRYFYSPALVDITGEFYLVTDRRVIGYSKDWAPQMTDMPFGVIEGLHLIKSDSWLMDSVIELDSEDDWFQFPVSMERGGDRQIFEFIEKHTGLAGTEEAMSAE